MVLTKHQSVLLEPIDSFSKEYDSEDQVMKAWLHVIDSVRDSVIDRENSLINLYSLMISMAGVMNLYPRGIMIKYLSRKNSFPEWAEWIG